MPSARSQSLHCRGSHSRTGIPSVKHIQISVLCKHVELDLLADLEDDRLQELLSAQEEPCVLIVSRQLSGNLDLCQVLGDVGSAVDQEASRIFLATISFFGDTTRRSGTSFSGLFLSPVMLIMACLAARKLSVLSAAVEVFEKVFSPDTWSVAKKVFSS